MNVPIELCGLGMDSPECGCLRTPGHFGPHVVLGEHPSTFRIKYPQLRMTKTVLSAIEFEIPSCIAQEAIADKYWTWSPQG